MGQLVDDINLHARRYVWHIFRLSITEYIKRCAMFYAPFVYFNMSPPYSR